MSDPSPRKKSRRAIFIFLLALIAAGFVVFKLQQHEPDKAGAGNTSAGASTDGKGGKKKMAISVTTTTVSLADVPISLSAIGNVEALETVSIQPQITGQLKSVFFKQGQFVKKGQLLFEIDPRLQGQTVAQTAALASRSRAQIRESRANVQKSSAQIAAAEANLKRDQAQLNFAQVQEERYKNLLAKNYVTREQYEQLKTTLATAQATIAADQAALANTRAQVLSDTAAIQTSVSSASADQATLESARIQLGFTRIYSPIDGKTGPLLITQGNNLMANTSTLVTIQRFSPILIGFSIPEKNLLDVQKAMAQGRNGSGKPVPVIATVQDTKPFRQRGVLMFIDNTVNASNGTVRLKSQFPNAEHLLFPGRFVNIELDLGVQHNAVVIPASAVQSGQDGDYVYVIEAQKAQMRKITVDRIVADRAIIAKGLAPGDVVVKDGQLRLSPGIAVKLAGHRR